MATILKLIIATQLLVGCGYYNDVKNTATGDRPVRLDDDGTFNGMSLDFATIRTTVLEKKCATCHEWTGDYVKVASLAQMIFSRISAQGENQMPPIDAPQLTNNERLFVRAWIQVGAPEHNAGGEQ